jgi:hypothetical protein
VEFPLGLPLELQLVHHLTHPGKLPLETQLVLCRIRLV